MTWSTRCYVDKITRILTARKKIVAISALVLICLHVSLNYHQGDVLAHSRDMRFLEQEKCPACYGQNLCKEFESGAIQFTGFNGIPTLKLRNTKNVYFGIFRGEKVVLKKLAHDYELDIADQKICELEKKDNCDVAETILKHKFMGEDVLDSANVKELSSLTACPSSRLLERVEKIVRKGATPTLYYQKLMLYTTMLVNPEPIILQIFPQSEGWPFPKFIGGCGRFIAQEFAGEPLSNFYDAPWHKRVDLAYQIFKIAEQLTNNAEDYALYFADTDWPNYAVDARGQVKIIDAESIFVVDKKMIRDSKPRDWDAPFYSTYEKCNKEDAPCLGYGYSHEKLCSRLTADFNFYAICREVLSPVSTHELRPFGLLHHIPEVVEERWKLGALLAECAHPSTPDGRMKIKDKITEVLNKLRTLSVET